MQESRSAEARDPRFWREERSWPFSHVVMPLAVYVTTQDITLSLLVIYVWETAEQVLSYANPYFGETRNDSLIGDPLLGASAIFAYAAIGSALGVREPFLAATSVGVRLVALLALGVLTVVLAMDERVVERAERRWLARCGVPLYTLASVGIILAFYIGPALQSASVANALAAWLALQLVYGALATPVAPLAVRTYAALYMRMLVVSVAGLFAAAIIAAVRSSQQ
jgi:hypothetical protein